MRKPKPRVLIDTNILISGLVFLKGNEHKILKLAEERKIVLVLPEFVLEEGRLVLARSFPGHEALLDAFLTSVEHSASLEGNRTVSFRIREGELICQRLCNFTKPANP